MDVVHDFMILKDLWLLSSSRESCLLTAPSRDWMKLNCNRASTSPSKISICGSGGKSFLSIVYFGRLKIDKLIILIYSPLNLYLDSLYFCDIFFIYILTLFKKNPFILSYTPFWSSFYNSIKRIYYTDYICDFSKFCHAF